MNNLNRRSIFKGFGIIGAGLLLPDVALGEEPGVGRVYSFGTKDAWYTVDGLDEWEFINLYPKGIPFTKENDWVFINKKPVLYQTVESKSGGFKTNLVVVMNRAEYLTKGVTVSKKKWERRYDDGGYLNTPYGMSLNDIRALS